MKRVEGVPGASLYAVEVKVDEAVAEFQRLLRGLGETDAGDRFGARSGKRTELGWGLVVRSATTTPTT